MYETVDSLFTGICDSIREKDGTTGLISHQDIPARIAAISSGEECFISPFYTYGGSGMKIENMVASNFNANSAIFLQEAFLPGDSPWEIGVKFTWPANTSKTKSLFGSWDGGFFYCPAVEIYYGGSTEHTRKIGVYIPNGNTSTWVIKGDYIANAVTGDDCWIRLKFDGGKYIASLSTNGQEFEDVIQINYGVMYQNATKSKLQFGGINRSNAHYFEGSIDLKETYIKIGGEIWWGREQRA